ncbi:exported protein [Sporosarcina luteola]|uniref:Exported protein n=1 Tax=Sporosarcina luteola TaxID=582850 RepID=A0A511Z4S7_9BACL|nr:DUF5050 domain-containing protein [Sporosarcina luteola]GEN82441.1 exported protein [Sporosarcina luteola]
MKKFIMFTASVLLSFSIFTVTPHASASTAINNISTATAQTQTKKAPKSYQMILEALLNGQEKGRFDVTEVSYKEAGKVIQQVLRENPEVMYYNGANLWSDGRIEFTYSASLSTVKANQKQLQSEVEKVLQAIIKPTYTDFEKVKAIHDYIALNTAYDYENYQQGKISADSYTAYGSLIKGIAVCDGYTKAAQLLMNRLGIENEYVEGYGNGEAHSWNLVKLDGQNYFMDITWDDPVPDTKGDVRYSYFLVTSKRLKQDHSWVESEWPVASSTKYAFFHDFSKSVETDGYYYFSNEADHGKLYRIAKDGTGKQKVNDVHAPYFAIAGDWIYFSNYSNGGYLFKMKIDGSNLTKLNDRHVTALSIEGNSLHYKDETTSKFMEMTVEAVPIKPSGDIVASSKTWTVTFNTAIDPMSILPENVFVTKEAGKRISVRLSSDPKNPRNIIVQPPSGGYEKNTNYVLTIQHIKSATNRVQQQVKHHHFFVQ